MYVFSIRKGLEMNLSNLLREECIQVGSDAKDKESILKEIAKLARKCSVPSDIPEDTLFTALKDREALGSTGFGNGVAIPHCSFDGLSNFVVGILTVPDGVEYDALDGEKAAIFVFIIGPTEARNNHIRVLARVSQVFRVPGSVRELVAEKSAVAVYESFLRFSRDEVDTSNRTELCLCHVFVQTESKFYDILETFTAMDNANPVVIEAKDAGMLLNKLPLFSSFLDDEPQGFNRIITATIRKSLVNDVIRQIDDIAGGLNKEPGIMITVHDLLCREGSLD